MKYLDKTFTLPAGPGEGRITACERCVYGTGVHPWWCPMPAMTMLEAIDALLREADGR